MTVIPVLPTAGHYFLWLYLLVWVLQGQSGVKAEGPENRPLFAVIKNKKSWAVKASIAILIPQNQRAWRWGSWLSRCRWSFVLIFSWVGAHFQEQRRTLLCIPGHGWSHSSGGELAPGIPSHTREKITQQPLEDSRLWIRTVLTSLSGWFGTILQM